MLTCQQLSQVIPDGILVLEEAMEGAMEVDLVEDMVGIVEDMEVMEGKEIQQLSVFCFKI